MRSPAFAVFAISALNPGLMIVDRMFFLNRPLIFEDIHFQYNGMLFAILLLSYNFALRGNDLMCGVMFAILLNFKHIFIYMAPAFFIYLLRRYCTYTFPQHGPLGWLNLRKFFTLGFSVLAVFAISFGPFVGHILQIRQRLFPWGRGLCHAYWAPNFWALYNLLDKCLNFGFLFYIKFFNLS